MSERTLQAVRRHFEAFAEEDLRAFFATYADDAVVEHAESLPFGGTYRGRQQIGRLVERFQRAWPGVEVTPVELADSDGWVLVLARYSGETAAGESVDTQAVEAFLLDHEAKIARHVIFFFDAARLREAL